MVEADETRARELVERDCSEAMTAKRRDVVCATITKAFAEVRREERAYIAKQIRENASSLVLFAGGNTRPLELAAWILEQGSKR